MYYKKIAPGKFVKSRVVKFPPSKLPLLVLLPVLALAQGGSKPPAEQSELAKRARSADPESGEWRRAEGMPPGAEFLPLTQDHGSGRTEFLIRFPKGYATPSHWHTGDETLLVVEGRLILASQGRERRYGPGSYIFQPGGYLHSTRTSRWHGCLLYVRVDGPFDLFVE